MMGDGVMVDEHPFAAFECKSVLKRNIRSSMLLPSVPMKSLLTALCFNHFLIQTTFMNKGQCYVFLMTLP